MDTKSGLTRAAVLATSLMFLIPSVVISNAIAVAQAPAAASQLGTVKEVSGNDITLTDKAGQSVKVTVDAAAKVLQLAPGSTDLKTAQASTLSEVAIGDRVLVTGKAGDAAGTFNAMRVVLMKSADIAQKNAQEQADWQKRGNGGIVTAIPAPGTLTISSGTKKVQVETSPSTIFRRYSGDSVKFEDAVVGTAAQIQVGDQLRVRGDKSDDGTSIKADEIVSGSFKNLAGKIDKIDAANGTITMKDLATKKVVTVKLTSNSAIHRLPERAGMMFAARAAGGARPANGGPGPGAGGPGGGAALRSAGGSDTTAGNGPGAGGGGSRGAGMDLSQMVARLPAQPISDLKVGDAVMIVGSQPDPASQSFTAVTVLSGVEPILAASPNGTAPAMTLSPWSVGGGGPGGPEGGI
jgi:co-chaperonin GroES (HSP10)